MKIANTNSECFRQSLSAEVVEESFKIAQMVAKEKKPHNIGKTLWKPCL